MPLGCSGRFVNEAGSCARSSSETALLFAAGAGSDGTAGSVDVVGSSSSSSMSRSISSGLSGLLDTDTLLASVAWVGGWSGAVETTSCTASCAGAGATAAGASYFLRAENLQCIWAENQYAGRNRSMTYVAAGLPRVPSKLSCLKSGFNRHSAFSSPYLSTALGQS